MRLGGRSNSMLGTEAGALRHAPGLQIQRPSQGGCDTAGTERCAGPAHMECRLSEKTLLGTPPTADIEAHGIAVEQTASAQWQQGSTTPLPLTPGGLALHDSGPPRPTQGNYRYKQTMAPPARSACWRSQPGPKACQALQRLTCAADTQENLHNAADPAPHTHAACASTALHASSASFA